MQRADFTDAFFDAMQSSILDVNQSETLPPACYADPAFFEFEKEAIFFREWLCVGREAWIREPGDYFTASHVGEPLIIVRNQSGRIKALSAVCQHRAALVAEGDGKKARVLMSVPPLVLFAGWSADRGTGNGTGLRLRQEQDLLAGDQARELARIYFRSISTLVRRRSRHVSRRWRTS